MKSPWQVKPASPEFRALVLRLNAEAWDPHMEKLNAMLLEAQNLRKSEGHKARERTLSLEEMDRETEHRSPEGE